LVVVVVDLVREVEVLVGTDRMFLENKLVELYLPNHHLLPQYQLTTRLLLVLVVQVTYPVIRPSMEHHQFFPLLLVVVVVALKGILFLGILVEVVTSQQHHQLEEVAVEVVQERQEHQHQ
jgi:uncharacterized integral membrane protein